MSVTELPVKPARPRDGKALQKGQQTKAAIVDAALSLATQIGLEGLSIGALAEVTQMSKSGVFAHFGSREELQISVVREYHQRFEQEVFFPSLDAARGLPRQTVQGRPRGEEPEGVSPCPSTTRPCATCSSCCTKS